MAYRLGLYEKAMPDLSWPEKLDAAAEAGFDWLEISVDESDEKLERLEWNAGQLEGLRRASRHSGCQLLTMCLSAHRRFPLGSRAGAARRRALDIMLKALRFSSEVGIRVIQLAGYDVYYEDSGEDTRRWFEENLARCVELAAEQGVLLGFETMETPFMDTVKKAMRYVLANDSPYLGIYPDVGNLTNASLLYGGAVSDDLLAGKGHILAAHLKDTLPGVYRNLSFGEGHTDHQAAVETLYGMGVRMYTGEFWHQGEDEWRRAGGRVSAPANRERDSKMWRDVMKLKGNPVSEGLALGPLFIYRPFSVTVSESLCPQDEVEDNLDRFSEVKKTAEQELQAICVKLSADDPEKAKIFTAHQDILNDEAVNEEITDGIRYDLWRPDWAIQKTYDKFVRMLKKAPDPLIRERAADLEDVRSRLLRIWYGVEENNLSSLSEPVIIVAHDLLPSDTATLDRGKVLAILTEVGGSTSHSAIIARSYEIPAVLGIPELLEQVNAGQLAAVDALDGTIELDPRARAIDEFTARQAAYREQTAEIKTYLGAEPLMADGVRIDIGLNIGSANSEEMKGEPVTDLVGLFRTEFLYMGRSGLPSEQEQFETYKKVLQAYGTRPVTLRTLDIGGDKTLLSMELPKEENPFLGNRALRFCFSHIDVFKTQLRAAIRASFYGNLWLMLPMVGSVDDIRRARDVIEEVKAGLSAEGIPYSSNFKVGIMVEIPSIAVVADLAAREVDFASIGTNDLCQYLTATDRMNPAVAPYYQTYHPALFRLIGHVVRTFNDAGKPICVCGEMGGDRLAAPVLIGLGMRKLSMGFASVAKIKKRLSGLTVAAAEELARNACSLPTAGDVEAFLKESL